MTPEQFTDHLVEELKERIATLGSENIAAFIVRKPSFWADSAHLWAYFGLLWFYFGLIWSVLTQAEPVMGAGGCVVPSPGYIRKVWEVCQANDIAYV